MCYQAGFRPSCSAVTRKETVPSRISSANWAFMHLGSKVVLEFFVAIQIQMFEQVVYARFLAI